MDLERPSAAATPAGDGLLIAEIRALSEELSLLKLRVHGLEHPGASDRLRDALVAVQTHWAGMSDEERASTEQSFEEARLALRAPRVDD